MASEKNNFSAAFKGEVALKALQQDKKNLDELSEKYNVPVSLILMWATQLEKNYLKVFEGTLSEEDQATLQEGEIVLEEPTVEVEVEDDDIVESVRVGAMHDDLNVKRIAIWLVCLILLVLIFVQGVVEFYDSYYEETKQRTADKNTYYQVNQLEHTAQKKLNSFGVVDLKKNKYRIPIDSAIDEVAADYNKK